MFSAEMRFIKSIPVVKDGKVLLVLGQGAEVPTRCALQALDPQILPGERRVTPFARQLIVEQCEA
jgi:hypothetical protein